MSRSQRSTIDNLIILVAAAVVAAAALLTALAISGSHLLHPRALPLALLPAAAGAVAAYGWWRERRKAAVLEGADERAQERLRREQQSHEQDVEDLQSSLDHERSARKRERQWREQLRRQVVELQRQRGLLGNTSDLPSLVLRIALELTGGTKGLLLSREDQDHDGDLDLAAAQGFENDPEHSAVVQRFAKQVLRHDETVRADSPTPPPHRTPADEEIENLVAIPIYVADRFRGVVVCANKPGGFHDFDDQVLLALGDHAGAVLHNARLQGDLRNSYLATVRLLGDALEANDPFLAGHSNEVSEIVARVADRVGIDPTRREALIFSALLHDVGKIGISERILLKPGPLTPEERSIVELHPRIGYHLVEQVPALREMALAILHHHERFDGAGYPAGLRGEQIPLEARIIAVVDSFSAMTSRRPYREPMSYEGACEELQRSAGTQFDPEIVRLFCEEVNELPAEVAEEAETALAADPELQLPRQEGVGVLGAGSYSLVDGVTLLYSHRHFRDVVRSEAQRAEVQNRPFGVVIVEVEELERINREQGCASGDEALQAVARIVQNAGGDAPATAFRYSGRRLALVCRGAEEGLAEEIAAKIERKLDGSGPHVRTSVAYWEPGDAGEDVVDRAREGLAAPVRA